MKYWYLVASLPSLTLGAALPLTLARLRVLYGEHLQPDDLADVDAVLRDGSAAPRRGASAAAKRWLVAEGVIRSSVARLRAARLGLPAPVTNVSHADLSLERQAAEAMARPDPLEREQALDRLRWHVLQDLAFTDPFGLPGVLSYALRLQLIERWTRWDPGPGLDKLRALTAVLSQAPSQEP